MAETYEQRVARLSRQLKGTKLTAQQWAQLVGITGQNVANITEAEQKPYDTMTKALLQGAASIEASQQRGVNAAALQTFQNYQDNLARLQTAAVAADENILSEARKVADQTSGGQKPGSPEWNVEFMRALAVRFGDGTNNNLLYGTMSTALREMGLDPNDLTAWSNLVSMNYNDRGVNDRLRAIQTNYARMHDLNTVTNKLLLGLNDRLRDAPIGQDDEAVRAWWETQRQDWLPLAQMNSEFKQKVMPAMSNENDVFALAIKANVAPGLEDASMTARALQEALLANPPGGADGEEGDKAEDDRRMALFISNPNTRRLADQYGLGIGTVLDLDEKQAEAFRERYPEGFYIPGVGLYISGVDDRKALQLAYNRLNDANPGNDGPFGIQPDEQPTYADVWLPAGYAPSELTALGEAKDPALAGAVYWRAKDGRIFLSDPEAGEVYDVAPEELPSDLKPSADPSKSEALLREQRPDLPMGQMTATPEVIKKHVEIQPNLYGDPPGRVRFMNPSTGKSELLPENARIEQVGGGGARQTLRGAVERMLANASSNRGAAYAEQLDTPMQERRKSGMEVLAETVVPRKVAAEPSRRHAPAPAPSVPPDEEPPAVPLAESVEPQIDIPETPTSRAFPPKAEPPDLGAGVQQGGDAARRAALLRRYREKGAQPVTLPPAAPPAPVAPLPEQGDINPDRPGATEVPFKSRDVVLPPQSPSPPAKSSGDVNEAGGAEIESTGSNRRNILKKYMGPTYGKVAGGRNPASTQDPMGPPKPSSLRA